MQIIPIPQISQTKRYHYEEADYRVIPGTGVVVGKFYPPHRGHKYLIDTSSSLCDALTVIVCTRDEESINGDLRCQWVKEIHPNVMVRRLHGVPSIFDDDSWFWANLTLRTLNFIPEFAFSSEEYATKWTAIMGTTNVVVDKERVTIPISGTMVRADPQAALEFLEPCVREYFERD